MLKEEQMKKARTPTMTASDWDRVLHAMSMWRHNAEYAETLQKLEKQLGKEAA